MSVNQGFYVDREKNLNLILTTSLVETVDKKIHKTEYLRVRKENDPINFCIRKISE